MRVFIKKSTYQMTTTQSAYTSLVRILYFLLFLSWWRALNMRSNHVETIWIPLEARQLNSFKNSFKRTKYIFSYILDDRVIYSWCLNILNIRFNVFRCIRCFDKKFGRLINLRTQHLHWWPQDQPYLSYELNKIVLFFLEDFILKYPTNMNIYVTCWKTSDHYNSLD